MATHRLYFGSTLTPDVTSTTAPTWQPATIIDTNDLFKGYILKFTESGAKDQAFAVIHAPQNFNSSGTTKFGVVWKSTVTSGNCVWDVDYRAIADAESLDQATWQESLTVTDATKGTLNQMNDAQVTATSSNITAGDLILVSIARDSLDAADTLTGIAQLVEAYLEYTD